MTEVLTLRDFQHANRLYLAGNYDLAPKPKFLYYVRLILTDEARSYISDNVGTYTQYLNVVNLLVKNIDLPKFSADIEVINQYNRKKLVQTKIEYQPINVVFHDDNTSLSTILQQLYYQYYFPGESTNTPISNHHNSRSTYTSIVPNNSLVYGLENKRRRPFFENIEIYQLSRGRYTQYILVNPLLNSWEHDTLDQAEGAGILENRMQISYEAVYYKYGDIQEDPPGFSETHYDNTPSFIMDRSELANAEENKSPIFTIINDVRGGVSGGIRGSFSAGLNGSFSAGLSGSFSAVLSGGISGGLSGGISGGLSGGISGSASLNANLSASASANIGAFVSGTLAGAAVTGTLGGGILVSGDAGVNIQGGVSAGLTGNLSSTIGGTINAGVSGNLGLGLSAGVSGGVSATAGASLSSNLSANIGGSFNATASASANVDITGGFQGLVSNAVRASRNTGFISSEDIVQDNDFTNAPS